MLVCSCDSIVIGKHALVFPPVAFGDIPPFKGGFSHLAASPPFSLPALSALFAVPEGKHLLTDRGIGYGNVLQSAFQID
jgi:hypothetical protein